MIRMPRRMKGTTRLKIHVNKTLTLHSVFSLLHVWNKLVSQLYALTMVGLDFAMAYFKRGQCYMMLNDFKRALYDFSGAILNQSKYFSK